MAAAFLILSSTGKQQRSESHYWTMSLMRSVERKPEELSTYAVVRILDKVDSF
jgi:hypothetical protein